MNKGLMALEDIILYLNATEKEGLYIKNIETLKKELKDKEKKDKALEIIKIKEVQVATLLLSNTCVGYNFARGLLGKDLTQEEYDLLKEVLL